ncbi:MAG: arginase family protein [Candidatus Limnocylindria bacterium]
MTDLMPNQKGFGFVGIPSFLRVPVSPASALDADVAVLGVPSDVGSPFLPGSRMGPRGIREHSLRFGTEGYYDHRDRRTYLAEELSKRRIVDVGDVDVAPSDVAVTFDRTTEAMQDVLRAGALPVILGGDHAITYPIVRAYEQPVHVVHFDAHIDYSPFQHGFMYTNMHAFRHIRRMEHVQTLTQVGIRSLRNGRDAMEDAIADGNRVIDVEEFRDLRPRGIAELLPADAPVYVSIDIDVLDMPLVPGCVSAEPNGLAYAELRDALVALSEHANVVGFDLVEVNPVLDVGTGITSYLAAHTIMEFLGHICAQPRWAERRDERDEERRLAAEASAHSLPEQEAESTGDDVDH